MTATALRKTLEDAERREAESVLVGVCSVVGIGLREVQGRGRTRDIATRRAVVAWILCDRFKWTRSKAATALGRTPRAVKLMLKNQRVTSPFAVK